MEKKYIDILLKIGESLFLDGESREILTNIDDGYYICYSKNWKNNIIESFNDTELINVFKGLIVAEQCYTQLCGSTTVGKILYREIENRNLDEDLKIANWAYINTRNGYIPFDSNGNIRAKSKDAYEFIKNSNAHSYQVHVEQEDKENRLLIKKIRGLEKILSKREEEIRILKLRLELSKLSRTEIANKIIDDNIKPVYFYYHEIEAIINDKSVDKKLLEKILTKFKTKEKKNIKDLKNKLIEEITNR
jgi:hypothetical protein